MNSEVSPPTADTCGTPPAETVSLTQLMPQKAGDHHEHCQFYVVGIGASAGGLEALEKLFQKMPENTGLAFVIIQHLSPDFQSHMDELLGRKTKIPIYRVEDGMHVEPDSIYLIPPKKEMIISQGRLLLTDKDPERGLTMPIDSFLRSLAQDMGRNAIGVILSGTGSDGSRGVRHIHEADGLVIVQDEQTAKFDGMPLAAINTGLVDLILPPETIPSALVKYTHDALSPEIIAKEEMIPVVDEGMDKIFRLLKTEFNIDFTHYKPATVMRRTERRSKMAHSVSIIEYANFVEADRKELDALYRDLLIGVTTFFRDPDAFEELLHTVVAPIVSQAEAHDDIRVWVPGCATGEEAYSLAILFHEQMELAQKRLNVKIFATDVHRESLEFASIGSYTDEQLGDISSSRRKRYFLHKGNHYYVVPELRQMIVFAPHNVIIDAPFTKLHFISCRNLLIYFQPVAQKRVLSLFHFGLRTNGCMILGPSESPGELRDEFDVIDKHWKIYRKRRDVRLPTSLRLELSQTPQLRQRQTIRLSASSQDGSLLEHYDALLARYMPMGILIDQDYQLLHTFGGAERYLKVKGGRFPRTVMEMFEDRLKTAILGGLQQAKKESTPVRYSGVKILPEETETLTLTIEPITLGPHKPGSFLISFQPLADGTTTNQTSTQYDASEMTREQIGTLESELRFTKENLQATIEELETSNEELQATNQELVASNEELQSTNEELQSVNEELYTVNAEHQRKITELTEMTDDMNSLLESTDVGVIYLDSDLCIRRFTPQMSESFNLLPQDVGRRLDTFAHKIDAPDLQAEVKSVLESEIDIEKQVNDASGRPFYLRILPYRSGGRVGGVVLTLIEISKLLEAEEGRRVAQAELSESEARKKAILESALDAIVTMDSEGKIVEFNPAAEKIFGYTAEEVIGQPMAEKIIPGSLRERQAQAFKNFFEQQSTSVLNARTELTALRKDGTEFPCELTVTQFKSGDKPMFTGFIRDISERLKAESAIKERETQFRGTFENAAVGMAHKSLDGGRWLRVNDRLCELLGYTREELLSKTFQEITHPDDLPANLDYFNRLLTGEIRSYQMEKRYIRKDGSLLWVALTCSLQTDANDHPMYGITIVQDISQSKQLEQDLQEAIQARESFLAMLSHELRNPLSAVLNATRLLRRGQLLGTGFSTEDITSVIERQSQQMAKLLGDLLDVSRITNEKIELNYEPVNLCELIHAVRETADPTLRDHDIALSIEKPDTPLWVRGDSTRLQQIQVNLLANAAKYSPPGSRVWYSLSAEGDEVVIRVKDEGIGIPAHLLEKIFEPFVQSDETLHRSEGGLGVGLTLVSSLVKMHGGSVTVQSQGRNLGSEFAVRLPRWQQADFKPSSQPSTKPQHPAKTLKIVLVEDQPDNANLLKAHLQMDGHQVSMAFDGKTGLDMILDEQPDLAIMDIGIPELDGYQVAERIREHEDGQDVFLVALTGYGQPADISHAKKCGFNAHLVKPLDLDRLREILRNPTKNGKPADG